MAADSKKVPNLRDLAFVVVAIPFVVLLGLHISLLANVLRRVARVPFLATMIVAYSVLVVPFWLNPMLSTWVSLGATAAVLGSVVIPIAFFGYSRDGSLEMSIPGHLVLIFCYLFVSAVP